MYQYSFANVDLLISIPNAEGNYQTLEVKGFATGENLITIARRAPLATTSYGARGEMVVNMQRIKATDLIFTVLMNAAENKKLQDYANYFESQADANGDLTKPLQAKVVDNMGKDQATLINGVVLAHPAMSFGQTMNTVTWVITFEKSVIERENGGDSQNLGI